ncbi:hypothetical protein BGW38_004766 [Lunasporangiospora selenospora]|uniref:Uncharacterized protein n=1 Tax=Lunasporangiospora selenospora TaxID=979761 RepID=A0A9P6FNW4_9FUNG|nr:hypothetical protein BGW38_004766 [Lunasporangiospora selenospora]
MLGLSLQDVDLEAFESLQIYWRAWSANQCEIEELMPLVFDLESRFEDDGVFRLVYIELSRNGFMPSEVGELK